MRKNQKGKKGNQGSQGLQRSLLVRRAVSIIFQIVGSDPPRTLVIGLSDPSTYECKTFQARIFEWLEHTAKQPSELKFFRCNKAVFCFIISCDLRADPNADGQGSYGQVLDRNSCLKFDWLLHLWTKHKSEGIRRVKYESFRTKSNFSAL